MSSMSYITRTTAEWQELVGESIRSARLALEIDQQSLADRASISRATLSKLENGGASNLAVLIRVLVALGRTDWLELLDESGGDVSPLAMARELSRQPGKRQRSPRKRTQSRVGIDGV